MCPPEPRGVALSLKPLEQLSKMVALLAQHDAVKVEGVAVGEEAAALLSARCDPRMHAGHVQPDEGRV